MAQTPYQTAIGSPSLYIPHTTLHKSNSSDIWLKNITIKLRLPWHMDELLLTNLNLSKKLGLCKSLVGSLQSSVYVNSLKVVGMPFCLIDKCGVLVTGSGSHPQIHNMLYFKKLALFHTCATPRYVIEREDVLRHARLWNGESIVLSVKLLLFQNGNCRTDLTPFCLCFCVPWHGKGLLIRPAKIYFTFQAAGTTEHWPQIVEEQIGRQRQDIGKTHKGRLQDNNCGGISGWQICCAIFVLFSFISTYLDFFIICKSFPVSFLVIPSIHRPGSCRASWSKKPGNGSFYTAPARNTYWRFCMKVFPRNLQVWKVSRHSHRNQMHMDLQHKPSWLFHSFTIAFLLISFSTR